jgi:ASC-1-like (ASCH) protein
MPKLNLHVQEPYYSQIKNGTKTVEGRLGKSKYFELVEGDVIQINDLLVKVVKVTKYSTFKEMLIVEGIKNVIPDAQDLESAINVYYEFYTKEEELKFGVAAIHFKLPN